MRTVAFFDSGIGGLSVLEEASQKFAAKFIFYADRDNVPYGEKPRDEILRYVEDAVDFLASKGADAVVLACNTATSVAASALRQKYKFPIIGMEPAAKRALDMDGKSRVLVTATPVTVTGEKMRNLIGRVDKAHLVDLLALPKLVEFAERGEFNGDNIINYLKEKLAPYNLNDYSALVLGCTHFNYFKDTFREILPETVSLVDGNEGTVKELMRKVKFDAKSESEIEYYYSKRKITQDEELTRLRSYMKRLEMMRHIN